MTTPDPGAQSIPITSADATIQHDRAVSEKQNARARFLRARGLSADPVPTPTPAPKTRRRLVVKNPQPDVSSSSVRPAGDPKPGRGVITRTASAQSAPPGADEVRMSRREFEAVARLIDQQPWSKSGKRSTVGQPIQRKSK